MQLGLIGKPLGVRKSGPAAALSLAFTSGTLDSRITFTRPDAATCATSFGSDGRLVTVAANIPRFDYDPATANGTTGPELVSNGDFSSGTTGWNFGPGTSVNNGRVEGSASTYAYVCYQNSCTVVQGKTYVISATVSKTSGANIAFQFNSQAAMAVGGTATPTTYSTTFVAQNSGTFNVIEANGTTWVGSVDNISVREVAFTPRGLLIEESRENKLLHSRDMTQAAWSKTDVTPTRNQIGLGGVSNTACLMTEGSAGTAWVYQDGAAITAGATVSCSIVAKRGNTDWVRFVCRGAGQVNGCNAWFNLATGAKGTVSNNGTGSGWTSSMFSLGGGWYRLIVSGVIDAGSTTPELLMHSAAADNSATRVANATYTIDCAQLEVGAFATSIIITDASTKTRAADSAVMTGTNFSSWWSSSAGTFVVDVADSQGLDARALTVSDGSITNQIFVGIGSNQQRLQVYTSGAFVAQIGGLSGLKTASAYAANDFAVSANGAAAATDASGALGSYNKIQLGASWDGVSVPLNGHIRRIAYYPVRLPNASLQALST